MKEGSGFTVVEMLVVISIITIITTTVIFNFRSARENQALERVAQRLAFDIRRAQTLALSGVNFDDNRCSYGIHIDASPQTRYTLFADKPPCDGTYTAGTDATIDTVALETGIRITSGAFDITFTPPKPTIFISGGTSIVLSTGSLPAVTRTITVNDAGKVSIQ